MILFWDRREVYMGMEAEDAYRAKAALADAGIECQMRVVDQGCRTGRGQAISLPSMVPLARMYYLYVDKKDEEQARFCLGTY